MNTKWYISTLIIFLALLGLNQERIQVANQQIVLQFTDVEMTSGSTHHDALATITKKLEALGIAKIEIIEEGDTQLSIRYYSDFDAVDVGKFLSQDGELSLSHSDVDQLPLDFPNEKLPETCSLVVLDFHEQPDAGLNLNGKFAVELNQNFERFSNPVVLQFVSSIVLQRATTVDVAYKINRTIAIAIDNSSQIIPEVRAGPYAYGNS